MRTRLEHGNFAASRIHWRKPEVIPHIIGILSENQKRGSGWDLPLWGVRYPTAEAVAL